MTKENQKKVFLSFVAMLFASGLVSFSVEAQDIPSPESFFGFPMGADRKLVDYDQLVDYFTILSERSSRLELQELGETTDGNPFMLAIISSQENLARQTEIQDIQAKLADARETTPEMAEPLLAAGKTIVSINCSIHSTEIGASQMASELAYELVTEDSPHTLQILDNVVVLLLPCHNPDGLNKVVDWYRKCVGTKYEGSRMPWLYHRYTGHDNNRDWFMFTQVETRLTVGKIYNVWRPHVVLDMHQMGSTGARLFLPPYIDPIDPNVDAILQSEMAMLGTHITSDLTAQDFAGVITNVGFDAYTPARAYPNYHGGIRFLSETASCDVATPIEVKQEELAGRNGRNMLKSRWNFPLPWNGGRWSLRDIVEYDKAVARSLLTHAARNRDMWLRNAYEVAKHAVEPKTNPYAFIIPSEQHDPTAMTEMLEILRFGLVELYRARESFAVGEKEFPAGTYVVPLSQPYGAFARTLLERTLYEPPRVHPEAPPSRPYDATTHNLPFLMGVQVEWADEPFSAELDLVNEETAPTGSVDGEPDGDVLLLGHESNLAFNVLNRVLKTGGSARWATEDFVLGNTTWPAGTLILQGLPGRAELEQWAEGFGLRSVLVAGSPDVFTLELIYPRLGVYQSWTAPMDEGWTRWVLGQHEFEYTTLHDEDVRNGSLGTMFDVIVFPDQSEKSIVEGLDAEKTPPEYAGGIGDSGVVNLRTFVQEGGTLIAVGSAGELLISRFDLPVKNVLSDVKRSEFSCPGSLLRVELDRAHPITFGMPETSTIFFFNGLAFDANKGLVPVSYAKRGLLKGGWLLGEEKLFGGSAVVDIRFGKGRVILFGFRPLFRAQTVGTFRLLFNAIYYGAAMCASQS